MGVEAAEEFSSEYGSNVSALVSSQLLNSSRDGVFAASCYMHCGFTLTKPTIRGAFAVGALYEWVSSVTGHSHHLEPPDRFKWVDSCSHGRYWPPCNPTCPLNPKAAVAPTALNPEFS